MQQEQPQYYRAVKASERLPEDIKVKGGIKSANGPYFCNCEDDSVAICLWRKDKFYHTEVVDTKIVETEAKDVVEWLEPIPIPDADRLREVLSRLYKQVMMGAGVSIKMLSETEEALSAVGDGWMSCEDDAYCKGYEKGMKTINEFTAIKFHEFMDAYSKMSLEEKELINDRLCVDEPNIRQLYSYWLDHSPLPSPPLNK